MPLREIKAGRLHVAYIEQGDPSGWPCILLHGFPYSPDTYRETAAILAQEGARLILPYLRGYGPTRFLSETTPRSGEQAVLGDDLRSLMDALAIDRAVLGGYDWGGRAACIVSALWPERVTALITGNSYNIQNIARSGEPASAAEEASYWYQYYFHSERGRRGLVENRRDIARQLWRMWSPDWSFDEDTFKRSAEAFDNPDFVDVVIHSYRHRFGLVPGDPAVITVETALQSQPKITVPTIAIDGASDGVDGCTSHHAGKFSSTFEHRTWDKTGHNLPQEQPKLWAQAVLDARSFAGKA